MPLSGAMMSYEIWSTIAQLLGFIAVAAYIILMRIPKRPPLPPRYFPKHREPEGLRMRGLLIHHRSEDY